jgi:hypothetical protein
VEWVQDFGFLVHDLHRDIGEAARDWAGVMAEQSIIWDGRFLGEEQSGNEEYGMSDVGRGTEQAQGLQCAVATDQTRSHRPVSL